MKLIRRNDYSRLGNNIPFCHVLGYGETYVVTKEGRVYNHRNARYLKPRADKKTGYLSVALYKDGKSKRIYIHRIVAQNFLPNYSNLPCINHKDGDRQNNHVDNLEWCTYSENSKHGYSHNGRIVWNKGKHVKCNNALAEYLKTHGPWNKGRKAV